MCALLQLLIGREPTQALIAPPMCGNDHTSFQIRTPATQVIAATNRADILDPALMRSGRLDRKVEFPHPNEDARAKILQIHSRKMNVGYIP